MIEKLKEQMDNQLITAKGIYSTSLQKWTLTINNMNNYEYRQIRDRINRTIKIVENCKNNPKNKEKRK